MKPVLFHIPGLNLPVYGFGLMVVVAFYVAVALAYRRSRRVGLDPDVAFDLALWMLLGGLVGARLFYVTESWGDSVRSPADVFKVWEGGVVYYGGVLGGFLSLFVFWAVRRFPLAATLDAVAPSVAIGSGLGRLGCFLNGCCYGDACDIPALAVRFPKGSPAWLAERSAGLIGPDAAASLPVHPTQLYSALDGLILFALVSAYYPLRRRDGEVMALLMVGYAVSRFLLEQLRDDDVAFFAGLTVSQTISVVLFAGGLAYGAYLRTRPPWRYADAAAASTASAAAATATAG